MGCPNTRWVQYRWISAVGFVQRVVSSSSKGNESWRKYSIWTYIFIIVWVLVLGLFRCRNLTVGAVVLTVVKRSAMVRDNHQLLDVTLETKKSTVRTSENSTQQIWRIAISLYSIQAMNETSKTSRESKTSSYKTESGCHISFDATENETEREESTVDSMLL